MKQKAITKSPLNSISVRSPMGKYSSNSNANNTPNSSSKNKDHSKPVSSTNKSSSKKKSTTMKKRKISELENSQAEIKVNIDKLRKDHSRLKLKLVKVEEDEMKQQLKFPIKDEQLKKLIENASFNNKSKTNIDSNAYKELKALPSPVLQLSNFLQPDDIVGEAIGVWDFLNVFSKTLSLVSIQWEDFVELLNFTGKDSLALNDIFCSLLKLILSDTGNLSMISNLIPRKVHFASRFQQSGISNIINPPMEVDFNMNDLTHEDDFDCDYNGLKCFPRKLKSETIDVLKLQGILRGIILRLDPVRKLRKAVLDITNHIHRAHCISTNKEIDLHELDSLIGLASGFKRKKTKSIFSLNDKIPNSSYRKGKIQSSEEQQDSTKKDHTERLDKDNLFHFTCDVSKQLKVIYEAVQLLESYELYQIEARYKIVILKVLCEACYDTQRIKDILERNADERAIQIQNMSKQIKDQNAKLKETSLAKKDIAFQACRKINIELAEETARINELEKKNSAKKKTPTKKKITGQKKSKTTTATTTILKGNGGGKDGFDPTPEQLNSMIEELVLLESLGIDVVEDIPVDEISDDENDVDKDDGDDEDDDEFEYDAKGNLIQRVAKRSRRVTSQMRMKALDRKRMNETRRAKQLQLDIAQSRLQSLLDNRSERDLRSAIKSAERIGCRGTNNSGKIFCTTLLKQAYMKLNELEVQAKEDKLNSLHERTLQEYFVRTMPIGKDRFNNQYWVFNGDDSRLFVQILTENSDNTAHNNLLLSTLFPDDLALQLLYKSRPNRYIGSWGIYSSAAELWQLWDCLDDRGERESALKAALKARFDIQEPAQLYLTSGSEYIGRKVKRVFGKRKPVIGLIVGWLPPTEEDDALWHVQHLDGDEEDLYESELLECLEQSYIIDISANANTNNLQDIDESSNTTKKEDSMIIKKIESDKKEQDEPNIARLYNGLCRGTPTWRSTNFPNSFGLNLLKSEITRTVDLMNNELKRRNAFTSREARKCWDISLREAANVSQVCSSVLELELVIRSLQEVDDKQDAEEIHFAKQMKRKEMSKEGWLFETLDHEVIGKHARRFFKGFGKSDGIIVAFLPANKNDGSLLFHMEHCDGDAEDLNEIEMNRAINLYADDIQEDNEDQSEGDDDNTVVSDDGKSGSQFESEPDDHVEEYRSLRKSSSEGNTLWPTAEVRNRWQVALKAAQTIGEVGLAFQAFVEQLSAFDMIEDYNNQYKEVLAPRSGRTKNGPNKMLSPLKSKFSGRENLSRAATRSIRSYAE